MGALALAVITSAMPFTLGCPAEYDGPAPRTASRLLSFDAGEAVHVTILASAAGIARGDTGLRIAASLEDASHTILVVPDDEPLDALVEQSTSSSAVIEIDPASLATLCPSREVDCTIGLTIQASHATNGSVDAWLRPQTGSDDGSSTLSISLDE